MKKKIFISHSSKDKDYGLILVNLLIDMGIESDQIIFTSDDEYGIPLCKDIFDYLKKQIEEGIFVVFLLSENYYQSIACLNEMGAAWMAKNGFVFITVPGFSFSNPKFTEGALNPRHLGFEMSSKARLKQFKNQMIEYFGLEPIKDQVWRKYLQEYMDSLKDVDEQQLKLSRAEKESLLLKYKGVTFISDGGDRESRYTEIKNEAKEKIIIVGVGMNIFSRHELNKLKRYLRNVSIDILMIDPKYLEKSKDIENAFVEFFKESNFVEQTRESYNNILNFCQEWSEENKKKIKQSDRKEITLSVYSTLPSMGMTLIDPDSPNAELVVEFFPFHSDGYRIMLGAKQYNTENEESLIDFIKEYYEELLRYSRKVV